MVNLEVYSKSTVFFAFSEKNRIYSSGSKLAGVSVDYRKKGFRGIKAFRKLIGAGKEEKV